MIVLTALEVKYDYFESIDHAEAKHAAALAEKEVDLDIVQVLVVGWGAGVYSFRF